MVATATSAQTVNRGFKSMACSDTVAGFDVQDFVGLAVRTRKTLAEAVDGSCGTTGVTADQSRSRRTPSGSRQMLSRIVEVVRPVVVPEWTGQG